MNELSRLVDRIATEISQSLVAERVAAKGMQLHRKDKDFMDDTGGSSKGMRREPNLKPPRDDVRKPFRKKNKPADQHDPDTDKDPDARSD